MTKQHSLISYLFMSFLKVSIFVAVLILLNSLGYYADQCATNEVPGEPIVLCTIGNG